MGLFDKLRNEFVDIIEWQDNTGDTLVWKFPRYHNEIKMGAKLTVRESQQAVFMNEGKIADVFQPGMYTLETQNLPILSTIKGFEYGFNSPFKADVFFVSTKQFVDQRWGTRNAITVNDERFGMIELRAFGTFAFRVEDGGKFIKEIAGTNSDFSTEEINGQLRSLIVNKFTNAIGNGAITIDQMAANIEELSSVCQEKLNEDFTSFGLKITKFLLENVSMPDDIKQEIFEYSRLNKIDLQKLSQMKAAKSIETAAANPGVGGMGVGMGVGVGVGNIVANTMNAAVNGQSAPVNTPPPIPQSIQYFVANDGKQTGPFDLTQLAQLAQTGSLKKETLVWKTGMTNWGNASEVDELSSLFNTVPPPLPQ
ncbi:MAG: antifreeze protein [Pseudopedobacter saltans]|uniref:Antifreeze protein n=1 Tax=Pseudopedobacter saltans TaxID=151895 RepID=A0A2W5HE06_9SPHI|nr:MAG: antifreeze protein [Pseudopedobacter saltans]